MTHSTGLDRADRDYVPHPPAPPQWLYPVGRIRGDSEDLRELKHRLDILAVQLDSERRKRKQAEGKLEVERERRHQLEATFEHFKSAKEQDFRKRYAWLEHDDLMRQLERLRSLDTLLGAQYCRSVTADLLAELSRRLAITLDGIEGEVKSRLAALACDPNRIIGVAGAARHGGIPEPVVRQILNNRSMTEQYGSL